MEKCMILATKFEKDAVRSFRGSHVDWRWEYVEDVHSQLAVCFPILVKYFDITVFASEKSADGARCVETTLVAVQCAYDVFLPVMHVVLLVSSVVGHHGRWFKGCYCHESILISDMPPRKKLKLMLQATGLDGCLCPWKGKRGAFLAHGHAHKIADSILSSTTSLFQEEVALATPEVAARMLSLERDVKSIIASTIRMKFEPWDHLPLKLLGLFGEFQGFSKLQCKALAQQCWMEFDSISDDAQKHAVAEEFLNDDTLVGRQISQWMVDPVSSLTDFPEAFVAAQELCLTPLVELPAEREHRKIQINLTEAMKPAMAAAWLRHTQTMTLCQSFEFQAWLTQSWNVRGLAKQLLEHMPEHCQQPKTLAELHARVYGFHSEEQYKDESETKEVTSAWLEEAAKARQTPAVATTSTAALALEYFKSALLVGEAYGIPESLFQVASSGAELVDTPLPGTAALVRGLAGEQEVDFAELDEATVYFKVIANRPECQVVSLPTHVAKRRSTMAVCRLELVQNESGEADADSQACMTS